jgi:hypothetical protein
MYTHEESYRHPAITVGRGQDKIGTHLINSKANLEINQMGVEKMPKDLCGGLSGETESREKLPRCAGFRLLHEAHLSAQESADERAVFQRPPDGLSLPFEQSRRQCDVWTEGKSGLFEKSPGGAGEHSLAACELGRQQDSNADVLLSSEIGDAVVPDGAWR